MELKDAFLLVMRHFRETLVTTPAAFERFERMDIAQSLEQYAIEDGIIDLSID